MTTDNQTITHPSFGTLKKKSYGAVFDWAGKVPPLTHWNEWMETRNNPDDNLYIKDSVEHSDADLMISTDSAGAILPEQIAAFEFMQMNAEVIVEQLPTWLKNVTEDYLAGELERHPSLVPKLEKLRQMHPFPSGEFHHFITFITKVTRGGYAFIILELSWSWSNGRNAQVLVYRDQILAVEFEVWDERDIRDHARNMLDGKP